MRPSAPVRSPSLTPYPGKPIFSPASGTSSIVHGPGSWVGGPQRPDDVYPDLGAREMVPWTRGLGEDYQDMIDKWDRLGIVVDRGSNGTPFFIEEERDNGALGP